MTIPEIRKAIAPLKSVSTPQLYRYLKAVKIRPVGARQKPQRYPDDTPARILIYLGFDQTRKIIPVSELHKARKYSLAKGGMK